jgi:subtilisin family serine protease
LLLVAAVLTSLALASFAGAQNKKTETSETAPGSVQVQTTEDGSHFVPGELLVYKDGGNKEDNLEVIPVEEKTLKGLKEKAKKIKSGRSAGTIVEPNYVYENQAVPNDPRYTDQYHLRQIGAPAAWDDTKGLGTRVCVIDTGYDRGNPEFANKVVAEGDVVNRDGTADDTVGHGTAVSGVVGVQTDNDLRTAAVGWDVRLVVIKRTNDPRYGLVSEAVEAMNSCQNVGGVSVINMSFGGANYSESFNQEVLDSHLMGQTMVASAGNDPNNANTRQVMYPANYDYVIGVGASAPGGALASFSMTGPHVDIVAPGVGIVTSGLPDGTTSPDGTSFSAPQVAAGAALLYSKGLTRDQVRSRLLNTADDRGVAGRDDRWGHGFLDLRCATVPGRTGCP